MERRAAQEATVDLIDSGQFLTAEEIFSERRTNDPMEMVVRTEVAFYFGRYDAGAALLDEVAPRVEDLDVAARFSLARGRLALIQGDQEGAETHLQTAYHFFRFQNDSFGLAHALHQLARLDQRRGALDEALQKLNAALEGIKGRVSKKSEFLRGLITSGLASVTADRGSIEEAMETYSEAARLLKNTERGRYFGNALLGIANLKCALGEYQDSLETYKEANTVYERYDIKKLLAEGQLKMASALIRLKRYERAEKLAEESRELRQGDPEGESAALSVLAIIALHKDELDEAVSRSNTAIELADQSNGADARIRARLAQGQVKLAEREFTEATEVLTEAVGLARQAKGAPDSQRLELAATIYLAEAYHSFDTRTGRAELARASEILNSLEDTWLGDEYNRVSGKYEEQIVFTDDNRLVFDGNQLPRWQEAKRTLEGFLLRNALRQTNNSLTRAARKLGVSKVHVHNLKKKHGL